MRGATNSRALPVPRRRRESYGIILAALLIFAATAAPAQANPLAPIWTGAYVGLNGAISLVDIDIDNIAGLDATRAGFGGHAGYNQGLGSWMLGIEFDVSHIGSSLDYAMTGGGTGSVETDWQGSLRGRLGMAVGPVLLYATAGWAWTSASLLERTAGGTTQKAEATYNGVVYGIGTEAFVLPSVSLKLEALRYDYGTEKLSVGSGLDALREIELGDSQIRAGVTIHFR